MPEPITEQTPETPSVEGVSDSTPSPVNPLVQVRYIGPLDAARVLGIDFPQGVPVWVDEPTAAYIEERHALDACFTKE